MTSISLGASDAGVRLDRFLADRLGISRARVRQLLGSGGASLDGDSLGYGDKGRVLPGSGLLVVPSVGSPGEVRALAEAGPATLPVLARGPGWVAVDKPAGCPVHPLRQDETGTVLNALAASHPEIHDVGEGGLRGGVLHRLDVDTSGTLLFATEEPVWQRLRAAFREHRVEKTYRAIVSGSFDAEAPVDMSFDLAVARHRPARVRVVDEHWGRGRRAYAVRQEVRVLERFAAATLVELRLITGFLHQIRVTLAHVGHPVVGDALYGDRDALSHGAPRQLLHAASVRFHEVAATSPDPADFRATLERLRGSTP